jgi:single-strand DNA-binding protein
MDLNKVQLIGRNTKDIEMKVTSNGKNVASFSMATNKTYIDSEWNKQEHTEFHNIVLWWKLAEIANNYLEKWKKLYIEWRLQTRSWEGTDWVKRSKTEIVWDNIILLGSKE